VLDRGKLAELGTHKKLLEKGGIYTTLYEKQVIAEELERGV
jgi:ABC-type multidrug transport system fused ATPase/permease subunit